MKPLSTLALAAALLAAGAATAQAQYCGPYGPYSAIALIEFPHPQENLFPYGGWTLYPGEAGSGVPSLSHYSHISGVVPPAVAAAGVLEKLKQMGVPIHPPAPQFLGRNPAIADGLKLPTPKSWLPKDDDKDKKDGDDPKDKDKKKDKDKDKEDKTDGEVINKPAVEKNDEVPRKLPSIRKPDR